MEQKYAATVDKVFALLTEPKWLQERSAALGELSAMVKARKSGGGVTLTMNRRVKRDLPGLVAKVLRSESKRSGPRRATAMRVAAPWPWRRWASRSR